MENNEVRVKNQISALIDLYITTMRESFADDTAIIESLLDIFTGEELTYYGYGELIAPYFSGEE